MAVQALTVMARCLNESLRTEFAQPEMIAEVLEEYETARRRNVEHVFVPVRKRFGLSGM